MPKRLLLRGGHVLTMDPALGDVFGGDVLIEGDRIAAVGRWLDAGDAEMIDSSDCIVMPGFIDSHRHTWETVIRGIAPDVSLGGYFDIVLDQLAPAYRPHVPGHRPRLDRRPPGRHAQRRHRARRGPAAQA